MGRFSQRIDEDADRAENGGGGLQAIAWKEAEITSDDFFKIHKSSKKTDVHEYAIDIVPYVIGGKKHPLVAAGRAKPGDLDYKLEYWVHRFIGPGKHNILCPNKMYGKRCPICEAAEKAKADGGFKDPIYNSLKAKQRVLYGVLDANDDQAPIKFLEISHFQFEQKLLEEAKIQGQKSADGMALDYADPDTGMTVVFRSKGNTFQGKASYELDSFGFETRDQGIITDDLIDEMPSLDEYLVVLPEDKIRELFLGGDADEASEEPATPRRNRGRAQEEEQPAEGRRSRRAPEPEQEPETSRRRTRNPEPDDEDEEGEPEEEVREEPRRRTRNPR